MAELSICDIKHLIELINSTAKDDTKVKFDDAKAIIELLTGLGKSTELSICDILIELIKSTANDDAKVKFDDAKAIIELLIGLGKSTESEPVNPEPMGVIGDDEYKSLESLGLGRGVDATKPYPWRDKSSIQVRRVNPDKCKNIIGTEESRKFEYYEDEVNSVLKQQFSTNLSVEEPSKSLAIGIGAEHSRSFAETRKEVGERIMTRTASFRADRDDCDDFEAKLSEWLLERIEAKQMYDIELKRDKHLTKEISELKVKAKGKDSQALLEEYITAIAMRAAKLAEGAATEKDEAAKAAKMMDAYQETWALLQHCYDYVEQLGITHYVHTIKLGAAKYEVLTQGTYDTKFSATPTFEINKVAKAVVAAEGSHTKHRGHETTSTNSIGIITKKDDSPAMVERGPPNEAVLEIELKPLHSLVGMRALQLAMQWALKRYIKRRESRKGMYYYMCVHVFRGLRVVKGTNTA